MTNKPPPPASTGTSAAKLPPSSYSGSATLFNESNLLRIELDHLLQLLSWEAVGVVLLDSCGLEFLQVGCGDEESGISIWALQSARACEKTAILEGILIWVTTN
ncbi:PGR5-LIKE A [Striga asiatica]|uniref:PGR5-LIKE A n=1 Tax=Striga asiatica TaxID=4170 RepID=A0A5A7Q8N7_STRAF|nr:PGR5-LIKE A [Striga asiatica]